MHDSAITHTCVYPDYEVIVSAFTHFPVVLKYIGYYAELPLGLPKSIEDKIIEDLQNLPCSQGTPYSFDMDPLNLYQFDAPLLMQIAHISLNLYIRT